MASKNVKEQLKRTRQRRKAEITLSTGDVIEMYFTPLTEAEDDKIREAIKDDGRHNAYGLKVLIQKAEYADGERMFVPTDAGELRNEYARADITKMMEALIINGGELVSEDPKSNQGGNKV